MKKDVPITSVRIMAPWAGGFVNQWRHWLNTEWANIWFLDRKIEKKMAQFDCQLGKRKEKYFIFGLNCVCFFVHVSVCLYM